MATVFLCTDTKFDRRVAIKLLHHDLAAAVGAERFHREIKIATGLTHPNILPAHDSGESGGSLFYVMPYVEGESLRARIDRERQLPVQDAVRITAEIASALHYAHSQGIVHRDIKPENILLESEHAVLADFGIARAVTGAADVEALTKTGMSLGTPGYMSPEQALGEKNIDGRSDQYSLACVAYEMLTGQPPFVASTMQALVAKHLGEPVPFISTVRPSVPEELEDVILRALEKVPADRFQTCGEFGEALLNVVATTGTWARRSQTLRTVEGRVRTRNTPVVPPPAPRRRLAIAGAALLLIASVGTVFAWQWKGSRGQSDAAAGLSGLLDQRTIAIPYFKDLSRDSSLGHEADGLTEGLIAELSRVRALKVVSRSGVTPYRNVDVQRDSIARALRAGSLIIGSVEPDGRNIRISTELVDGNSGALVERASFEIPATQLIGAIDSLVRDVAELLRRRLRDEVRLQERRAGASNLEAWTRVQVAERHRKEARAFAASDNRVATIRSLAQADTTLQQAANLDKQWAAPVLARGWIALQRAELERESAKAPWYENAERHADQVLSRTSSNAEALALRGEARFKLYRLRLAPTRAAHEALLRNARIDLEAAVATDPSMARANIALSHLYYDDDDVSSALLAARRAYDEDAYLENADLTLSRLFWGSLDLEQFKAARDWCAEGARRFPRHPSFLGCQLWLMATPAVDANPRRAWELLALLDSVVPPADSVFLVAQGRILVAGALARAGLADSARRVLSVARVGVTNKIDPDQDLISNEAYIRGVLRDHDIAIDLLKRYVAANPGHGFAERAGTVWWWRDIRAHRRWNEVAQP